MVLLPSCLDGKKLVSCIQESPASSWRVRRKRTAMPKKYEREIEEILRNMERSAPKPTFGQRLRRRPEPRAKRPARLPSFNFGLSEWCLLIAWAAALLGGGWAYAHYNLNTGESGTSIFTGGLAVVSLVCLLIIVILPFITRSRYPRQSANNGKITPLRRNPLSSFRTRWNLFQLKLRYRRRKDQ